MKKKNIFNTLVSVGTYQSFIDEIIFFGHSYTPSYVCFANVHMIIEAYCNKSFQRVINESSIVAPDGKPISTFLRISEGIKQARVCGMDIMPDLLKHAAGTGESVYFYGSTDEVLKKIIHKANQEFPALKIAGYHAPPFRILTEVEDTVITDKIRNANPNLVFVSLGCPKQEKWMADHTSKLNACLLGLGQAFKVYAGEEKRLPKWMRNLSLEWVYRLYLEPGRLWRRYMYTNSFFLFLVIRHFIFRFLQTVYGGLNKPSRVP